jgi:hypothetical protein
MRTYLLSLLDRAARTAIHTGAGYLVVSRTTSLVDWRTIAVATAFAVVFSIFQSVVDFPALPGGWIGDVTARALRSFAATVVGSIGSAVLITQVPWPEVLTAAALAAASSVITSSIATPLGPEAVKGTPNLVSLGISNSGHPYQGYVGYTDVSRHLRVPTYRTSSVVAGTVAGLALVGMGAAGVTAAHTTQVHVVAVPVPAPSAAPPLPPVTPPTSPERAPAFLAALQRNGIPTANDGQALLLLASSVCTYRLTTSDAALTDKIVGVFPGRWTHAQAALIVDAAVDSYCV